LKEAAGFKGCSAWKYTNKIKFEPLQAEI